ncbi:hypothetical protein EVAR_6156_1 [Eumeta japonica]|uniref:Uncharacterized protein n=1 Tax=Eumeta variegata TaxID=151549 RepID=A0A4C1TEE2_EUMVA|nr:hypothetical protein EVAR_6156_1 [Eumeta japonica]
MWGVWWSGGWRGVYLNLFQSHARARGYSRHRPAGQTRDSPNPAAYGPGDTDAQICFDLLFTPVHISALDAFKMSYDDYNAYLKRYVCKTKNFCQEKVTNLWIVAKQRYP